MFWQELNKMENQTNNKRYLEFLAENAEKLEKKYFEDKFWLNVARFKKAE